MHPVSWTFYKAELAEPTPEDRRHDRPTEPMQITGYYRLEAAKTKPDYPVMIWTEQDPEKNPTGATIFQIGRQTRNTLEHADKWEEFIAGSWLKCVAVSRIDYSTALERGRWPSDSKPSTQLSAEEKLGIEVPTPGGNDAPPDQVIADQIKALQEKIEALNVVDQQSANDASSLLDKMSGLLAMADAQFDVEKRPHLEAGRVVDAKWNNIRTPARTKAEALRLKRNAWLAAEQRKLDAEAAAETERLRQQAEILQAARRAEAARQVEQWKANHVAWLAETEKETHERLMAEAEKIAAANFWMGRKDVPVEEIFGNLLDYDREIRAKAIDAAAAAKDAGAEPEIPAHVAFVPPVPEVKPVVAAKAQASSDFGRATSAKKEKLIEVVDPTKLCAYFIKNEDTDFIDYLDTRAKRAGKGKTGVALPGVKISEV